jgi:hypothetical protein
MVPPEQIRGRTGPAAKRKTAVGAMTPVELRRRSDLVSAPASYIDLTKGLTPFA